MPYFTPRVRKVVEAYRLPQEDQEPTDGLIFFLRELNLLSLMGNTRSGDWIVRKHDGSWQAITDKEFRTIYKSLED